MDNATEGDEAIDPMKANSNSEDVKFDLEPRKQLSTIANGTSNEKDLAPAEISIQTQPSKEWELDVRGLVSTKKWLQNYGLKKNRMDIHNILPQIGFKHSDEYDDNLKKPICSRYGNGVFPKTSRSDGKTFNIASNRDKLNQLEARLQQAIALYKRRLDWLTSESRRIFGVVEEKSVCVVLDIVNMSPQLFRQYRTAMERVIKEQIAQLAKFNMIRATEDTAMYQKETIAVTSDSIDGAIEWLWALDRTTSVSPTATCEALVRAIADTNTEAVYLFTEGSSCDGCRELLKEKLTGSRVPVHVVSYNCDKADTISFLKDLTKISGGKFHAYAVTMEMDSYERGPLDEFTNQANILLKKKTFGGVPPGAGVRDDVINLFEEMEEARNTLAQIQGLIDKLPDHPSSKEGSSSARLHQFSERSETYMSSREWLAKHGLKPKKLGFYDVLAGAAFKHRDGVVDVKHAPAEEYQTDAINHQKLVNAKYCDLFPCVRWKNGEVVHVQVTPELHRVYEQRMNLTITAIKQRIDWLQQGSRELFGTVIEDKIYIIIDTSASMKPHLQFVKDKLFILMQEQLRHKQQFNLIAFDSRVSAWRDRLIDVNEKSLRQAWQWIRGLMVSNGSTNTMAALRSALADNQAEAIYLLTDGRPDQPPKSVLAQVQLQPQVPIHTISFNCSDKEANEFLCQLAKDTQGRYHYYSESGVQSDGPEPWESEDIRLLRLELETGCRNLEKITMLRDECSAMAWKKDDGCKKTHSNSNISRLSLSPRSSYSDDLRPHSAPGFRMTPTPPHHAPRPATATGSMMAHRGRPHSASGHHVLSSKARPRSAVGHFATKPLIASHTRTSLLRAINNNGQFTQPEWLLPETRQLFENQWSRQQKIMNDKNTAHGKKNKKRLGLAVSSKKWLSQHGLAAKKLTILDALSPTFIPHEPKYVPILNKHVLSKVFDDLLPIAHASGPRRKIRIVNPQGVDLNKYKDKVEKAIAIYQRRLDRLVWNALPQTEKENFDGDGPVSFEEERLKLMDALDRCGWPVEERNIILLENEIKQARSYIQQAENLQDMSKNGEKDGESDTGSARDSEVHNSRPNSAKRSIKSLSPRSDVSKEDITMEQPPKPVKPAWNSNNIMAVKPQRTKKDIGFHKGQKVIARNTEDGYYYPGSILKVCDSRHAIVKYVQLGKQKVPGRFIVPISGAITRPTLKVGDYALCRVVNQDTEMMCYVPGIVTMVPARDGSAVKFFTVTLYTGHREHFVHQYLIKINKIRYTFLIRYIREVNEAQANSSTTISEVSSDSRSRSSSISSRPRNPTPSKSKKKTVRIKEQSDRSSPARKRSVSSHSSRSSRSESSGSTRSRSRSRSESSSRSRSRSRSSSGSRSQTSSKTHTSTSSKLSGADEPDKRRVKKWMNLLQRQQKKQRHMQKKLKRQTSKLNKLQQKILKNGDNKSEDQKKLLENILNQLESITTPRPNSPDKEGRTQAWIQTQNSSDTTGKDGVVIANGKKGILISNEPLDGIPEVVLDMRGRLKPSIGEEILARWADEGWYYRGTIKEDINDGSFIVEDSAGDLERIWREDVIRDADDTNCTIHPEDAVIALHPTYNFSYAPGVILEVESDFYSRVRFYDGEESRLPREEIYYIPAQKFKMDVAYITQCEDQWVGQAVVSRNNQIGHFELGAVRKRVGNGRQYMIEWSDGQLSIQNASCIFGAFTKRHSLALGDKVLAISDPSHLIYLPGSITATNGDKLVVEFCDNTVSSQVEPVQCFWLSDDYYNSAVNFYKGINEN